MMRLFASLRRLRADRNGVALLEFAFAMPIVLTLGLFGIEIANLALINLKISQIALNLADNASRVGLANSLSQQNLREIDMNDVLQAARLQGASINLTTNGRIIVSSLENVQQSYDSTPVQRIHWQRCMGTKGTLAADSNYNSSYGTTLVNDGTDWTQANDGTLAPSGMGDTGSKVSAPAASGVMFVEVNYQYQPVVGSWLIASFQGGSTAPIRLHYIASFIVRDRRVFTQIYNPSPTAAKSTCNLYVS